MRYFYPFLGFCTTLTAVPFSLFILNSTSNSIENAKHVEVFFYGKKTTTKQKRATRSVDSAVSLAALSDSPTGSTGNNVERIKVWIEDLNNFSKFEYCSLTDSSSSPVQSSSSQSEKPCNWKNFIALDQDSAETSKKSKYYFLAKLAKYFLLVQHNLNLLKSLNIEKNNWELQPHECKTCKAGESDKCCILCEKCAQGTEDCKCCKDGEECVPCCLVCNESGEECKCKTECSENCKKNFQNNQKKFYFSLKNLTGIATNKYLTALQAHINLPDIDLNSDLSNVDISEDSSDSSQATTKKHLSATLIYGFTDYYYKVLEDMPDISSDYAKITKKTLETVTDCSEDNNKKYFLNLPHKFSFTVSGISSENEEGEDSENNEVNLVNLYKKLSEKTSFLNTFEISSSSLEKSSSSSGEDNINCLLNRNFVFLVSKLENANCFFKCKCKAKEN